jgi:hypothetical protein
MLRRLIAAPTILIIALACLHPAPVMSQGDVQALTHYAVTVYSVPDRSHPIVGVLVPQAKVILEARNPNASWVLGRSTDGAVRGWMERRYLDGVSESGVTSLVVSAEEMFVAGVPPPTGDYSNINLHDFPVVPVFSDRAHQIFEAGRSLGRNPHAISKIGDCISDNGYFLSPFGWGQYDLGVYTHLQSVIDHFGLTLAYDSHAAYDGLVTTAVLDALFANPLACQPGETPLRCEYRVHRPSVAIIMFGAQDLLFTGPAEFDRNLRQIVHETIQTGVLPILSTFPGNLELWNASLRYNRIVVQIAIDYDIPLMNLWKALETLPNHGLNDDGRHLSLPVTDAGDLTEPNLERGYPLRNLVTLQALDAAWRDVMN